MARYFYDCETDGLLDTLTVVDCLVLDDIDTGEVHSFADQPGFRPVSEGVVMLMEAEMRVGHNIIGFDDKAIAKVFPWYKPKGFAVDTLILGRLLFPDIKQQIDFTLNKRGKLPGHLMGRHSLESWGYRIGNHKGEYTTWCKDNGIADPWKEWRPEKQAYCVQDVSTLRTTFKRFLARMEKQKWRGDCVSLEHDVKRIIDLQIERGFAFDHAAATKLHVTLTKAKLEIEEKLQAAFPPKTITTAFYPKVNNKARGYVKGQLFNKVSIEVFNPSSRQMIAARLREKFAWEPADFTDNGQPKIDESTLEGLEWPEAKLFNTYLMLEKRLAALVEGKQGWMKVVKSDGRIHGNVNTMGAATSRMTHNGPNISQVPSVTAPYGKECRSLFVAGAGYTLVGCDADALELRCLAHYMASYDGGAYVETVLCGDKAKGTDMHSQTSRAIRLDPKKLYQAGGRMAPGRDISKEWFYAYLYGAGDDKLGVIVGEQTGPHARSRGRRDRAGFVNSLPALGSLIAALKAKISRQGYIFGIDGRTIPIRHAHAALNTLLQSAGAIVMKRALVILQGLLVSEGLREWSDFAFVANVHDEFQLEVIPEKSERVGQLAAESIKLAGEYYRFRCPLAGQHSTGTSWAFTH